MKIINLFVILLSLVFIGCVDIIESDLGEKNITIIAPYDSARNDKSSQSFFWEDLREDYEVDIEFYNLQIVQPSFDNANRFVLDTNLTTNTYSYSLEAGDYQWRVRAENANTKTPYITHTLFVDSLFDLTNVPIVILSPQNGQEFKITTTAGTDVILRWDPITGVDEYTVEVVYGTFDASPYTIYGPEPTKAPNLTQTTVNIPKRLVIDGKITGQGTYEWIVRAKNIKTNTRTSASRRFTIVTDTLSATN